MTGRYAWAPGGGTSVTPSSRIRYAWGKFREFANSGFFQVKTKKGVHPEQEESVETCKKSFP